MLMIAQLTGKIMAIQGSAAVVAVGDASEGGSWVGYQVFVSTYTLGKLAGRERVTLHIHTHVREDAFLLYGFLEEDELRMFELLISVSGIGPKVGLSLLSIADVRTIRLAVVNKDPTILTRVSGVGKKTAEKIIVELQNKVTAVAGDEQGDVAAGQEALEALTALGYSVTEAREALKHIAPDIGGVSARIRAALKILGK